MERPDLEKIRDENNKVVSIIHARSFDNEPRIAPEEWLRLGLLAGTIWRLCEYIEYLERRPDAPGSKDVGREGGQDRAVPLG